METHDWRKEKIDKLKVLTISKRKANIYNIYISNCSKYMEFFYQNGLIQRLQPVQKYSVVAAFRAYVLSFPAFLRFSPESACAWDIRNLCVFSAISLFAKFLSVQIKALNNYYKHKFIFFNITVFRFSFFLKKILGRGELVAPHEKKFD